MSSLIVAALTEEQLQESFAAADLTLAADELERLDKVSEQKRRTRSRITSMPLIASARLT